MTHSRTSLRPAAVGAARLLLAAALAMGATAHAGRSCEARKPTPQALERGMQLAERTARALDAEHQRSGARVVLLARAGQDLSKYGVHYSHMGWAYRTPGGPWRVAHKLNDCGTAVGSLYRQGLGEFFLDDLWRHEAVWLVPAPDVQARLAAVLAERPRTLAMHRPAYSMVSYAWGTRYQQSNQWALETLALAMEPEAVRTRAQAQAWLRARGVRARRAAHRAAHPAGRARRRSQRGVRRPSAPRPIRGPHRDRHRRFRAGLDAPRRAGIGGVHALAGPLSLSTA